MTQDKFAELVAPITDRIRARSLDKALEEDLNRTFPADGALFQSVFGACRAGIAAGWMCNREAGGIRYGRVVKPGEATHGFSIDVVEMEDIAGPHHSHPNGEIDMIMPLGGAAEFDGHGSGWLVYAPGSAHRPTVGEGKAIVLYLLPQGSIEFTPGLNDEFRAPQQETQEEPAMPRLSTADHRVSPPQIDIPRDYNAAHDLIERNLQAGRSGKTAYIDDNGGYTYGDLAERVNRCANALISLGLEAEQRVFLCILDTIDFPTAFLGSIKAGIVPIAANTLLTTADYEYMLRDSRAHALIVSAPLLSVFAPLLGRLPHLKHVIVCGTTDEKGFVGHESFSQLLARAGTGFAPAATTCDDMCFWLYSSGSTGAPKGTVHTHSSLISTAELYAWPILGIREDDVVFSAAKLFFAYGLGNGLTFPLSVGATTVLMAERPTPSAVFARLKTHQPTIFYGVPTLFAALLASPELPQRDELRLRRCTSAGEALPADIGKRWTAHFGVEVLDGLGSTEMLHIFLSNRAGNVRYGTSGTPVPGYELRILGDDGDPVAQGQVGELQISGPTSAMAYWANCRKSRDTFQGPWTRSGDKYSVDGEGFYVYAGRTDDMLKVSGIYVSPVEVESALITHPAVLEAAVIGKKDEAELIKPVAYVVLKAGHAASDGLAEELRQHVKSHLAPYKYPRWIEFIDELPKTATGKIQRFKLRQ